MIEIDQTSGIDAAEGRYVRWGEDGAELQLVCPPGGSASTPLAALVSLDGDGLDRAEAILRFCRRLLGRPAPDGRLTPFRRRRIPMELRAADARSQDASYRDIAEAIHGRKRLAEESDWRTSSLRTEAIDLVAGGNALIAGGYRKLFRHRRRP